MTSRIDKAGRVAATLDPQAPIDKQGRWAPVKELNGRSIG